MDALFRLPTSEVRRRGGAPDKESNFESDYGALNSMIWYELLGKYVSANMIQRRFFVPNDDCELATYFTAGL